MPAVALLRWPRDEEQRRALADGGTPRLLLIDPGQPLPELDDDEDFIRLPADERDVSARLRQLGLAGLRPRLDGRVLRNGRGTVVLSERQAAVVALLLAADGTLVPRAGVVAAFGGRAVGDAVYRLRKALRPLGLEIYCATNRGYVLGHDVDLDVDR